MRKWILITIVLLLVLAVMGLEAYIQIPYFLIFGWIHYLVRVMPTVHVNYGMMVMGMAAFVLAVSVAHMVFRWLWRQGGGEQAWRREWTMRLCLLVPVLFGITIAAGGMVHQAGWLAHESPWIEDQYGGRRIINMVNASHIAAALRMWASDHGGKYPDRLDQLFADGVLDNHQILHYVPSESGTPELFVYLPGLTDSDPPSLPLVIGPHSEFQGKWMMVRNDGGVALAKPGDFAKAMQAWREHVAKMKEKSR